LCQSFIDEYIRVLTNPYDITRPYLSLDRVNTGQVSDSFQVFIFPGTNYV